MSGLLLNNFGVPAYTAVTTWPTPPTGSGDHEQDTYSAAGFGGAAILTKTVQMHAAATYDVFGGMTGIPPFFATATFTCLTAEVCAVAGAASLDNAQLLSVTYPSMGIGIANGPELPTGFDPATFEMDIYLTSDFSDAFYPSPNTLVASCVGVGNLSTYPSGSIDSRVNGLLGGLSVGDPVRFVATFPHDSIAYVSSDLGSPWGGSTAYAEASCLFGGGLGGGPAALNVMTALGWVPVGTMFNPLGVRQADGSYRTYDGSGSSPLKVCQADGSWLEVSTAT